VIRQGYRGVFFEKVDGVLLAVLEDLEV